MELSSESAWQIHNESIIFNQLANESEEFYAQGIAMWSSTEYHIIHNRFTFSDDDY